METKWTIDEHRQRHITLHLALDELFADYINQHPNVTGFLAVTMGEFLAWSSQQTHQPTTREEVTDMDEQTPNERPNAPSESPQAPTDSPKGPSESPQAPSPSPAPAKE